jgi:hypothetical protein
MEDGVLWRTDVMGWSCAVARGEDINRNIIFSILFRSAVRVLVSYYPGSLVLGYRATSVPALRRYASPPDSRGTPGKRTVGPEEAN